MFVVVCVHMRVFVCGGSGGDGYGLKWLLLNTVKA
jgi:hypothetical protein